MRFLPFMLLVLAASAAPAQVPPITFQVLNGTTTGAKPALDALRTAEIARQGINPPSWWPDDITAVDFDNDGALDLYIGFHSITGGYVLRSQLKDTGQLTFMPYPNQPDNRVLPGETRPLFFSMLNNGWTDIGALGEASTKKSFKNVGGTLSTLTAGMQAVYGFQDRPPYRTLVTQANGLLGVNQYKISGGKCYFKQAINNGAYSFTYPAPVIYRPAGLPDAINAELDTYAADTSVPNTYGGPVFWEGDLNGDGLNDCVISYSAAYANDTTAHNVKYRFGRYLLRNPATGLLEDKTATIGIGPGTPLLPPTDLNGDGRLDIITTQQPASGLFLQQAGGTFAAASPAINTFVSYAIPYPYAWRVVDFNGDGKPDVFISNLRNNKGKVFQNNGGGVFTLTHTIYHWDASGFDVADINGDGLPDLIIGGPGPVAASEYLSNTDVTIYLNTSTPPLPPPQAPTGLTATGGPQTITLTWAGTATTWNLYRGATAGSEALYKTGLTVPGFTDSGLGDGATFFYQASGVNAAGEGPRCPEVSGTTAPPLPPPTSFALVVDGAPADMTGKVGTITVDGAALDLTGKQTVVTVTSVGGNVVLDQDGIFTTNSGKQIAFTLDGTPYNTAGKQVGIKVQAIAPPVQQFKIAPPPTDKTKVPFQRLKRAVDAAFTNPYYGYKADHAALVYLGMGEAKYATEAVRLADALANAANAEITAGGIPYSFIGDDTYYSIAGSVVTLTSVLDWCGASVTPAQRTSWEALCRQAVYNVWNPRTATWGGRPAAWNGWAVNDPGNNYHIGFIQATVWWWLWSREAAAKGFLDQRLPALTTYYAGLPEGGSREGTGYGLAQEDLFDVYRVYQAGTGVDLSAASPHALRSPDYWLHATLPTLDRTVPLGDQPRQSDAPLSDDHRHLMLSAIGLSPTSDEAKRGRWWLATCWPTMTNQYMYEWDLLPSDGPSRPPSETYYGAAGAGHYFWRTDWTPQASFLSFVAGKREQGHSFMEQGAFNLFKGKWHSVSASVWSFSGIVQNTDCQNIIRFEKSGQVLNQPLGFAASNIVVVGNGTGISASADLSGFYAAAAPGLSWTRTLTFDGTTMVVTDATTLPANTTANWQIQLAEQPTIVDARTVTTPGLRIVSRDPVTATILDWRTSALDQFATGWRLTLSGQTAYQVTVTLQ